MGPKDLAKEEARAIRRDTGLKQQLPLSTLATSILALLDVIQGDMLARATAVRDNHLKYVEEWSAFVPALDAKNLVMIPWCEEIACEDQIKERSSRV